MMRFHGLTLLCLLLKMLSGIKLKKLALYPIFTSLAELSQCPINFYRTLDSGDHLINTIFIGKRFEELWVNSLETSDQLTKFRQFIRSPKYNSSLRLFCGDITYDSQKKGTDLVTFLSKIEGQIKSKINY